MAEEIIYQWDDASDLVLEVMGVVSRGTAPSRHKLWSVLADPSLIAKHRFRLMDASGKEVVFPLNLISDTSIEFMADY